MTFVDGTNFLCHSSEELDVRFKAEKPPPCALSAATTLIYLLGQRKLGTGRIRNYWFSYYKGSEVDYKQIAEELRKNDFEPVLFKKRGDREKGVDIALAKEMLVNAFNQNFELGLLVAGDEDYVCLVNEVKRYGQIIYLAFFSRGLSDELKLACDKFYDIIKNNPAGTQSHDYKHSVQRLKSL